MERFENDRKLVSSGRLGCPRGLFALAVCLAFLSLGSCRLFAQAERSKADKPNADESATGNAQNGKTLFASDGCYECHGRAAQGAGGTPRLGPNAITLAQILAYVRHPAGGMPPYTSKVISDAELTDIYAFLQSLPEPRKVEDIPLLNAIGK